ncbi:MAG TPA: cache and HAMP domain-containing protein [Methylomirabilota bacterium]|nr:cache and HAMP domain-containing protein [Methylomirabilota bacterium]
MAKRPTFGIFPKVLLTMIAVAVIPLGAIWYVNQRAAVERIEHAVDQQLGDRAEAVGTFVDAWTEMNVKMLRQNAALDDIVSMDARRQRRTLVAIANEYKAVYLAFTIAPDGTNIGRSDQDTPKNYGDRLYVQQVLHGAPLGQQVVISRTNGQPALILSVPVTAEQRLVGVLAIGMTINDVSSSIAGVQIGRTGHAFLLDTTGKVIAHPRKEYVEGLKDLSQHPAFLGRSDVTKKRIVYTDEAGRSMLAYARKTKEGWTLVVQQDVQEAYAPITAANRNALVLLALTLLLVVLASYLLAQRLTRPIRSLTRIADEISRGNLKASIPEAGRSDEIGALARAVDRLGASIKAAMARLTPTRSESAGTGGTGWKRPGPGLADRRSAG